MAYTLDFEVELMARCVCGERLEIIGYTTRDGAYLLEVTACTSCIEDAKQTVRDEEIVS